MRDAGRQIPEARWASGGAVEHKVDLFSKPPRVRSEEIESDADGWASQHGVAQMKKTDRAEDWPIVDALGRRLLRSQMAEGVLHITERDALCGALRSLSRENLARMSERRPLLKCLAAEPPPPPPVQQLLP